MKQDTIASKVGRPPKFKTPEELEAKAEEYFRWCDANPIRMYKRKGAGVNRTAKNGSGEKADEGEMFVDRPYTQDGLGLFVGVVWRDFRAYHQDDEFSEVIRTLEARIRDKQVVGALCNLYAPNLTARINGISENVQVEGNIPIQLINDGMDDE